MNKRRKQTFFVIICLAIFLAGCAGAPVVTEEVEPPEREVEGPAPVRPVYDTAETAYQEGRYAEALSLYADIIARFPDNDDAITMARLRRGEIRLTEKDYSEALTEFALIPGLKRSDPLYYEVRTKLARAYAGLEMDDVAVSIVEDLTEENVSPRLQAELSLIMGDILARQGNRRDAVSRYMTAIDLSDDEALILTVRDHLEKMIEEAMSVDELTDMAEHYREGYPAGYIAFSLARSHYESGETDTAAVLMEDFLSRFPDHQRSGDARDIYRQITDRERVDRYTIGCLLPLTGDFASFGARVLEAIILASRIFESSSDSPFTLIIEDTKSQSETVRESVRRLAEEEKVMAIIGPLSGDAATEAAAEAQERGVPLMTVTPRAGVTGAGRYVFRHFLDPRMEVKTLIRYARENLGMKTFAILYPKNAYGTEMMSHFWDEITLQGGDIRGVETYRVEQTDFGREIKALAGIGRVAAAETSSEEPQPTVDFDAVFIPDGYARFSMIAPQLAFYNVTGVQLLGTRLLNAPELVVEENEYVEGTIFVGGFFQDSFYPRVRTFVDRFYMNFGRLPTDMEALAYDAARIIFTLIEEGVEFRDDLTDGLFFLSDYWGVTGETTFATNGDAQKELTVLMVQDNSIVQIN